MKKVKPLSPEEQHAAEIRKVAAMDDEQVLAATAQGKLGPGIIGQVLYDRGLSILKARGGGAFGPAIMDPEYARKQEALRRAELEEEGDVAGPVGRFASAAAALAKPTGKTFTGDPLDDDADNPWKYVTLSGAKMLAQKNGVSYKPKVLRAELIPMLVAASVTPPPVPSDVDDDDDELL